VVALDKDVSVVDSLAVKLFTELMTVVDEEEAKHREAQLWKAQKKSVSNILVPPPPPDVPSDLVDTQQYAAIQNPPSALTGNVENNVPSLEEEMTAVVTPMIAAMQSVRLPKNLLGFTKVALLM
jgi:hypothetical protein